jgi:hypothetical protein
MNLRKIDDRLYAVRLRNTITNKYTVLINTQKKQMNI